MNNRDRYHQNRSDRMNQAFNGGRTGHNIIDDDRWQMPLWVWAVIGIVFAIAIVAG